VCAEAGHGDLDLAAPSSCPAVWPSSVQNLDLPPHTALAACEYLGTADSRRTYDFVTPAGLGPWPPRSRGHARIGDRLHRRCGPNWRHTWRLSCRGHPCPRPHVHCYMRWCLGRASHAVRRRNVALGGPVLHRRYIVGWHGWRRVHGMSTQ
jgi:hypothetical protein